MITSPAAVPLGHPLEHPLPPPVKLGPSIAHQQRPALSPWAPQATRITLRHRHLCKIYTFTFPQQQNVLMHIYREIMDQIKTMNFPSYFISESVFIPQRNNTCRFLTSRKSRMRVRLNLQASPLLLKK